MGTRPPLRGYNHNIRYRNRVYHVQTEDSGLENPHVFTHLFLEGQIISSARTDYEDLVADADNEKKVRKLMQEQHKSLMKRLRGGEFDEKIVTLMGMLEPVEVEAPAGMEPVVEAEVPAGMAGPPLAALATEETPASPLEQVSTEDDVGHPPDAIATPEPAAGQEAPSEEAVAAIPVQVPEAPTVSDEPSVPDVPMVSDEPAVPAAPPARPTGPGLSAPPARPTGPRLPAPPARPTGPLSSPPSARPPGPYFPEEIPAAESAASAASAPSEVSPAAEVTEAIDMRRLSMPRSSEVEVTQPIDIRALHGFDRHAIEGDGPEVSVIIDGPPTESSPDVPDSGTYSHVYRENEEEEGSRRPPPVRARIKTPLPLRTPLPQPPSIRRHSRVFGQPLPGSTRYPSSDELPSVGALPRKSGVYLVPGGPPQRPPHPDPAVRRQTETPRVRASSPHRYTAPSRPLQPKPRPRRQTGSYEVPAEEASKDLTTSPLVAAPTVTVRTPSEVMPTVVPRRPTAPQVSARRSSSAQVPPIPPRVARPPGGAPQPPRPPVLQPRDSSPEIPPIPPSSPVTRPLGHSPQVPRTPSSQLPRPPSSQVPRTPSSQVPRPPQVRPPRPPVPVRPAPQPPSREQVVARPVVVLGQGQPGRQTSKAPSASVPRARTPSKPASEPASVFGSDLISERSLDEVILAYLAEDSEAED